MSVTLHVQAEIIRMFQQFMLFEDYQERLREEVGEEEAERIVKGALVLITLGGNDMVNNYFLTDFAVDFIPTRSSQFSVSEFCHYLISEYRKILMVILCFFFPSSPCLYFCRCFCGLHVFPLSTSACARQMKKFY